MGVIVSAMLIPNMDEPSGRLNENATPVQLPFTFVIAGPSPGDGPALPNDPMTHQGRSRSLKSIY